MNSPTFEKSFIFNEISQKKYRHTDASHGINYNFLALMLDGHARIESAADSIELDVGDMFFIPLGCRYHSYWYGNDTVRWTSLGFRYFPCTVSYTLQKLDCNESQRKRVQSLGLLKNIDCASIGQLYTLLTELLPTMKTADVNPNQPIIDNAVLYMSSAPQASMSDVAKHCNISESGLYAAFRTAGTTPVLMRQQIMIDRAVTLITTTDLTADEIAYRCGFSSTAYFLRILKKLTGKTTREIRRSIEI